MTLPQILDRTPRGEPGPPPTTPEADSTPVRLPFDNTYARLPERFYARVGPTPVAAPGLVRLNEGLAGRWSDTARGPLQQPGAETIFQAGEELADRRGRQSEALRCAGQAAMLDDLDEHRHLAGPVGTQDL